MFFKLRTHLNLYANLWPLPLRIRMNSKRYKLNAKLIVIINAKRYGLNFPLRVRFK